MCINIIPCISLYLEYILFTVETATTQIFTNKQKLSNAFINFLSPRTVLEMHHYGIQILIELK